MRGAAPERPNAMKRYVRVLRYCGVEYVGERTTYAVMAPEMVRMVSQKCADVESQ